MQKVTELDVEKKTVALASGETFKYDGCLVATGGMYVSPPPPPSVNIDTNHTTPTHTTHTHIF